MRTLLFSTLQRKFAAIGCLRTKRLKCHELLLLVFLLMLAASRRKDEFSLRELGCYGVQTLVINPLLEVTILITQPDYHHSLIIQHEKSMGVQVLGME